MRLQLAPTLLALSTRKGIFAFRTFVMSSSRRVKDEVQMPSFFTMGDFGARPVKRRRVTAGVSNRPQLSKGSPTETKPLERLVRTDSWIDLCVPPGELRPAYSLTNGQCFNWRKAAADCWVGVLGCEVIAIRQTPHTTLFRSFQLPTSEKEDVKSSVSAKMVAKVRDYFFLSEPLEPLYRRWSKGDIRMAAVAAAIPGVRVVRQNPVECIFSFICSSNNNIPRITLMLEKLRRAYGEPLLSVGVGGLVGSGLLENDSDATLEDWTRKPVEFYSFPTVEALAEQATEASLREMGFGYRAKYIVESTKHMLAEGGAEWAMKMRDKGRDDVRDQLITLSGVGPKVADCVALFSLDQASAIPVDVHVWRIACRDYDPSLQDCKSLTPTVYARVGDLFRKRFGERAGWAHSLLFAAELPTFKALLSPEMQREMDEFREEERATKAALRTELKMSTQAMAKVRNAKHGKTTERSRRRARNKPL